MKEITIVFVALVVSYIAGISIFNSGCPLLGFTIVTIASSAFFSFAQTHAPEMPKINIEIVEAQSGSWS